MKFLCPACERITEFSSFRTEGTSLVLRCSRCGVESQSGAFEHISHPTPLALAPGAKAAPSPALKIIPRESEDREIRAAWSPEEWTVPAGFCPKCIGVRPVGALACAHCGLLFANFRPEELQPPALIADRWNAVLSRWDELSEHDRLLQAALVHGELATVGRLYRIRLARNPGDPIALRGRDEVLRLASAGPTALANAPSEAGLDETAPWKYAILGLFILICAVAFLALYRQIRSGP